MDVTTPKSARRFRTPENWYPAVDARMAAALLAASADLTLVVARDGTILDVALGNDDLDALDVDAWIGRPWADVVAPDSRRKAVLLIEEAEPDGRTRWREINHLAGDGSMVPINFTAMRLSDQGDVVAFGRDLATVARLQQRVIEVQRAMEADYARLRNAETRYRLLFQMAREAVLVVDAATGRVVEANPASARIAGTVPARLVDRPFRDLFEPASHGDLQAALMSARTIGRAQEARLKLSGQPGTVQLTASHFRQEGQQYLLVRLSPATPSAGDPVDRSPSQSLDVLRRFPEPFVVIEPDGKIASANQAFLDIAELASLEAARNVSVDRWLGRPGIDFGLIQSNLRDHGSIRDFATVVRGELGGSEDVDVTAVAALDGETPCIGIVMRPVRRRAAGPAVREAGLSPTVESLTHLVGTMPLKDLVRETTDMIEQMCIEAALKLTDDNKASAAQILGLSRQSLYAKLHRFGLVEATPDDG
jgi:transcriptional regulator PpsR